jgi:ornithine cyclodeaminase
MRFVPAAEIDGLLTFPDLVEALAAAFRAEITVPVRHHHSLPRDGGEATHLLMPAWTGTGAANFLGTKIVNVFPGNGARGLPSIHGLYLLMSGETGVPLVTMDGTRLTAWRTAAASALASRFLSRADAASMVMVGAGALAPFLIRAHASVRPLREVALWNHRRESAAALVARLAPGGAMSLPDGGSLPLRVADDLAEAVAGADIVACATLSHAPLVRGEWLRAGAHLDLVGAYRPDMRESDDACVTRARLFVDTRAGALKEGGDIADPLARGVITADRVEGDLFSLCRDGLPKPRAAGDITLFKSVGTAIEDLAAAMLVWQQLS